MATAAGLCYGSLGSDTGGSIRFPSAACGIVGIKPTWGRVSRYGVLALAESLDHVGPMTRSAVDAGIMLQAIAGHDPNDPTSLNVPVPDMLESVGQGVKGIRIGLDERYISEEVDAQLTEAVLAGARVMEGLGAEIVPVKMPKTKDYCAGVVGALRGGSHYRLTKVPFPPGVASTALGFGSGWKRVLRLLEPSMPMQTSRG